MSVEFVKVQVMVNGKKQEIQMEKGTSFENNGGIYTVDENGQLKKFDKSSNVWTDASSIEMRNYQWQAFQNVANNDGDGATYSKADIEQAMAMSGDALDTDMSNNLPSGYKIERSADEVPEGTFAVDVSYGDKKAATLKFSLAEIAELKAASQAREAGFVPSDNYNEALQTVKEIFEPDWSMADIYFGFCDNEKEDILSVLSSSSLSSNERFECVRVLIADFYNILYEGGIYKFLISPHESLNRLHNIIDRLLADKKITEEQASELYAYSGFANYPDGAETSVKPYEHTSTVNIKLANGETKSFRNLHGIPRIERKDDGSFVVSCYQGDYSDGKAFDENDLYSRFIVSPDGEVDCKMRYGVLYNTRTMTDGSVVHEQVDKDTNEVYYRKTTFPDGKIVEEDFQPDKELGDKHVKTTLADGSVISSHFDADGKEISRDAKYYDGTKIEASNGNLETARLRGGNNTYENGVCTKSNLADKFFTAIDGLSWDKSDLEACISNLTSNNIISVLCAYNSKAGEALEVAVAGEWAYGGSGSITDKINELLAPRIAQAKAQGIEIKGTTPTEIALELAQFDSQMLAEGKWAN